MPIRGLATLEQSLPFVARHDLVEDPLLGVRVVEVVVDDVVAERAAGEGALLERADRLAQRVREALGIRLVRVALEPRRWLEPALEAVEPGGDQRGEREVRVHVATGDPRLHASRAPVPDHAETACAVVLAPRKRRRRPRTGRVALVRV